MELERIDREAVKAAGGPAGVVTRLRKLAPIPAAVTDDTRRIVRDVFERREEAVLRLTREHDTGGAEPRPLVVAAPELDDALRALPLNVVAGLQVAIANVAELAQAGVSEQPVSVTLPQRQVVTLREVPVDSAAVYVPGGRAPYPSTAVMGVVTARAAGVTEVVVCSPPGRDGQVHPVILGTCRLLGVQRVYRMGGAQAIAALAFGTDTVGRVDVIVGPGNLYVQEAKRELSGVVGIDGFAGPSDLMVVVGEDADPDLLALDLLAQAEHGAASVVVAVSPSTAALDRLAEKLRELSDGCEGLAPCVLVETASAREALALANEFAPEHLQLVGAEPEALAPLVRSAGCLLVGEASATAFSDYVAGSNHVLPTAGAARFASGLSARHFRRRMSEVRIDPAGAGKLAAAGAPIARAEGFEWHARSMEARAEMVGAQPSESATDPAGAEPSPSATAPERLVGEN
ncbi:MAG TPA: histidinol dehydrogenase [Solirubrobacteraceae bacterium]|jgi:histidinol dehydrogenase|nr:histidinol dehydrogenase [Solirubrobacteraceae bacterium]